MMGLEFVVAREHEDHIGPAWIAATVGKMTSRDAPPRAANSRSTRRPGTTRSSPQPTIPPIDSRSWYGSPRALDSPTARIRNGREPPVESAGNAEGSVGKRWANAQTTAAATSIATHPTRRATPRTIHRAEPTQASLRRLLRQTIANPTTTRPGAATRSPPWTTSPSQSAEIVAGRLTLRGIVASQTPTQGLRINNAPIPRPIPTDFAARERSRAIRAGLDGRRFKPVQVHGRPGRRL